MEDINRSKRSFHRDRTYRNLRNVKNIELDQFDFSSKTGWDNFYTQLNINKDEVNITSDRDSKSYKTFEFEWHSSMQHENVISEIEKDAKVIVVGNGNSRLPREIYDYHDGEIDITCLDYSQPCVDMMLNLHSRECPRMDFVCGDVTKMNNLFEEKFDVLVDKGLMDALMCTEGFEKQVSEYWREAKKILKPDGKIILVAYKVSSSTWEFLDEIGKELNMEWTEQESKGNGRISFIIGRYK